MVEGLCTSCGAELPPPDVAGLITCPNCQRVTRSDELGTAGAGWPAPPVAAPTPGGSWAPPSPVAGAPSPPPAVDRSAKLRGPGGSTVRSAGAKGCGVALAIAAVLAIAVVGTVRSCSSAVNDAISSIPSVSTSSLITLSGTSTVVASSGGRTDVIATIQENAGSDTVRRLALIRFADGRSQKVWETEPIGDSASRAEIAQAGTTFFAGVDDTLYAIDAQTGDTRWSTTLRDKVTTGCPECFGTAKGNLVVRTADAYVTAFGQRSSEPLWTKRLNSPSGSLAVVGGQPLVIDDPEDATARTTVALLDPADGRVVRATAPTCPRNEDTPWELEISPGDTISEVGTQHDVVAAFGFGDACVVRWNPASGAIKWTSRLDGASSLQAEQQVMGERDLVVSASGGAMVSIDLSTGKAHLLEVPADVRVTPDRIVGRTLVADTVTVRGTPKGGLAGWDLTNGDRIWAGTSLGRAQPTSRSRYFSSDALFDGSPRSLLVPAGEGLNSFVFDGTDRTFAVRPLDLGSGDLGTEVKRGFVSQYESGTPSLTVEAITPTHLLVSVDSRLQIIPVSGRGAVVGFPGS